MLHLTAENWQQLRARTLDPKTRAALLAHLAEDCADCDAIADGIDDVALDAAVDAALGAVSVRPADEVGLARVERRVLAAAMPRRRLSRPWLFVLPAAVAAGLVAVALAARLPLTLDDRGHQQLKGEAALSAAVARARGAALEPLQPGARYPPGAELYFTWQLPTDAHVYLGRVGIDGAVDAFYPPGESAVHRAGVHPLTLDGTVHAYSLQGLSGVQRFVLLTSPEPLSTQAVVALLRQRAASPGALTLEVGE